MSYTRRQGCFMFFMSPHPCICVSLINIRIPMFTICPAKLMMKCGERSYIGTFTILQTATLLRMVFLSFYTLRRMMFCHFLSHIRSQCQTLTCVPRNPIWQAWCWVSNWSRNTYARWTICIGILMWMRRHRESHKDAQHISQRTLGACTYLVDLQSLRTLFSSSCFQVSFQKYEDSNATVVIGSVTRMRANLLYSVSSW